MSTDRELLKILAEIARELGHFRQHLHRIEAVQCKLVELLEARAYPASAGGTVRVQ